MRPWSLNTFDYVVLEDTAADIAGHQKSVRVLCYVIMLIGVVLVLREVIRYDSHSASVSDVLYVQARQNGQSGWFANLAYLSLRHVSAVHHGIHVCQRARQCGLHFGFFCQSHEFGKQRYKTQAAKGPYSGQLDERELQDEIIPRHDLDETGGQVAAELQYEDILQSLEKALPEEEIAAAMKRMHAFLPRFQNDPEYQSWIYLTLGIVVEDREACGFDPIDFGEKPRSEVLSSENCYRRAIKLDPLNGEAHKRVANVLLHRAGSAPCAIERQQEMKAAQKEFDLASQLLPHDILCAIHSFYGSDERKAMRPLPLINPRSLRPPLGSEGLSNLIISLDSPNWAASAAATFEQFGAVVVPQLLEQSQIEVLGSIVERECDVPGWIDDDADATWETRSPECRMHKALRIRSPLREILSSVMATLWPLLSLVLQSEVIPLIGTGFMRVAQGADAQGLHKDVFGYDRYDPTDELTPGGGLPRAIVVQIQLTDTMDERHMGSLELLPGTHRPDTCANGLNGLEKNLDDPESVVVPVAVPAGTVTVYSSRLYHQGGKNPSSRNRDFCFLDLIEEGSPAPHGLIHTFSTADIGKWTVRQEGLHKESHGTEAIT